MCCKLGSCNGSDTHSYQLGNLQMLKKYIYLHKFMGMSTGWALGEKKNMFVCFQEKTEIKFMCSTSPSKSLMLSRWVRCNVVLFWKATTQPNVGSLHENGGCERKNSQSKAADATTKRKFSRIITVKACVFNHDPRVGSRDLCMCKFDFEKFFELYKSGWAQVIQTGPVQNSAAFCKVKLLPRKLNMSVLPSHRHLPAAIIFFSFNAAAIFIPHCPFFTSF